MKKFLYMARVSILLVTVVLIAGMLGCSQTPSPLGYPDYPVTHIACGEHHTVGVKVDGTVVTAGSNYYLQCNVDSFEGIIWGLSPTAPWSPRVVTVPGNARSAAGGASPRSPQATVTRWALSPTAPWSPLD